MAGSGGRGRIQRRGRTVNLPSRFGREVDACSVGACVCVRVRAYACSMGCRFALRGLPCPARPCPLPRTNLLRPGQSLPDPAQAPSLHTTSTPKLTVKYQPVRNIPCLPLGNSRGPPDPCPLPHRCPTAARPPRRARPRAWAGPRARSKHAGVDADARRRCRGLSAVSARRRQDAQI